MNQFSVDNLRDVARHLNYNKLKQLCNEIPIFDRVACSQNLFWQEKFLQDYGSIGTANIQDWKLAYEKCRAIVQFGDNVWGLEGVTIAPDLALLPLPKTKFITTSISTSFLIDEDGETWSFGDNDWGQLGRESDLNDIAEPRKVDWDFKVKTIACAPRHTLVIDTEGWVWGFGDNRGGQISNDRTIKRTVQPLAINIKAIAIGAGADYSVIITPDGEIVTMGKLSFGRKLQVPNVRVKSVSCNHNFAIFLDSFDRPWYAGADSPVMLRDYPVVSVDTDGRGIIYFIDQEGELEIVIANNRGEIIDNHKGMFKNKFIRIACNSRSAFLIDSDNRVWWAYSILRRGGTYSLGELNSLPLTAVDMVANTGHAYFIVQEY